MFIGIFLLLYTSMWLTYVTCLRTVDVKCTIFVKCCDTEPKKKFPKGTIKIIILHHT